MEFVEVQKLKLWWLYIIFGIEAILIICITLFDKGGMSWQDLKNSYFLPFFAILIPFLLIYFITKNKLTVKIDQCGISYHYWPFANHRAISWTQIEKMYIRKYDALQNMVVGDGGLNFGLDLMTKLIFSMIKI